MGCTRMGNLAKAAEHGGCREDPLHEFPLDVDKADLALSRASVRQKDTIQL